MFLAFGDVRSQAVNQVVRGFEIGLQTLLLVEDSVVLILQRFRQRLELGDPRFGRKLLGLELLDPCRELCPASAANDRMR